jgi:hypothetical protein
VTNNWLPCALQLFAFPPRKFCQNASPQLPNYGNARHLHTALSKAQCAECTVAYINKPTAGAAAVPNSQQPVQLLLSHTDSACCKSWTALAVAAVDDREAVTAELSNGQHPRLLLQHKRLSHPSNTVLSAAAEMTSSAPG